jgi:hypothetical protein
LWPQADEEKHGDREEGQEQETNAYIYSLTYGSPQQRLNGKEEEKNDNP